MTQHATDVDNESACRVFSTSLPYQRKALLTFLRLIDRGSAMEEVKAVHLNCAGSSDCHFVLDNNLYSNLVLTDWFID